MNVTGTQTDARSQTHINSSITVTTSIALHRIITVLYCIACTSSRERHISQKRHLGLKLSLAASHFLCAVSLSVHVLWLSCSITWASHMPNSCFFFIHTHSSLRFLSNDTSAGATTNEQKTMDGRVVWDHLSCCDGSSVCHQGCQGNQGWGWKGNKNSFIVKHTHTHKHKHASPCFWRAASRLVLQSLLETRKEDWHIDVGDTHQFFLFPKYWREPREDGIIRHLPWNCLYLPPFLCHARSPSLCPPSILLSSSLSSLVLVFPLSIQSSLCSVNLPLANLMSGLSGCLLDGSRLCAFQALWQCFPQVPLVSPHTANIHAAHRRMRVGGGMKSRITEKETGGWVHLLRLGWTNPVAKWLAKWEKRAARGLRETKRGERKGND